MTDPPRWLEDASDAPDEARELLRHARPTRRVDRTTLVATAAVVAELSARPAAAVALAKLAALPQALAALPVAAKLITTVAVVSAVAIVTVPSADAPRATRRATPMAMHRASPTPDAPVARAPRASSAPPSAAPTVIVPVVPSATTALDASQAPTATLPVSRAPARAQRLGSRSEAQRDAAAAAGPAASGAPVDALAAEVATLDDARNALGRAPALALRLVDEHAARFPGATLAAERELIAIDALVRLGRRDQARTRAARLREHQPHGLYESRLSALLE